MSAEGVLIVGYGNALRSDDGLGPQAAAPLAADPRLAGAQVLARHQLTPELAEDIARSVLLILVDARDDGSAPGCVQVHTVSGGDGPAGWSHHVGPSALLDLAARLSGSAPPAVQVSVGIASTAYGDRLSPVVELALPQVVEAVRLAIVEGAASSPRRESARSRTFRQPRRQ